MQWGSLVALRAALLAPGVHAMLRFSCSQLVTERLDPLVNPGLAGSPHLHQVVGGNSFNTTMDPANDMATLSTCTTCTFSEDFSNYWTPVLYFKAQNGTYKRVPQMGNQFLEQAAGGMTVYYIAPYDGVTKVTAFKQGFRMLVGDPNRRKMEQTPEADMMSFRCFDANFGGENAAPGMGSDTRSLPPKPCAGGIRANVFFPTCWDGVNLDSADHKSHVSFPANGSFETGGPCPSTHPVKIPQILYETVWDTTQFNDPSSWPTDGSQPFVFSQGDDTGYGQHADYVFGWKGDALQTAMDVECNVNCPQLKSQATTAANQCIMQQHVKEDIDGWLDALPGMDL